MAKIVCVHGIAQQYGGATSLKRPWLEGLRDGLQNSGPEGVAAARQLRDDDVEVAYFGDYFRPPGEFLSADDDLPDAIDLTSFERELLNEWWAAAAATDEAVHGPDDPTLAWPKSAQTALVALSNSRFFAGLGERLLVRDLIQVRRYFTEPALRRRIRQRVLEKIVPGTQLLIGHSLGSVVAYEALCAGEDHDVRTFLTLGSPLGVSNLIYHRLEPAPRQTLAGLQGRWPGGGPTWTNIADQGDVVALVKKLAPLFGPLEIRDRPVDNGARAHDISRYLSADATGKAVLEGLGRVAPPTRP